MDKNRNILQFLREQQRPSSFDRLTTFLLIGLTGAFCFFAGQALSTVYAQAPPVAVALSLQESLQAILTSTAALITGITALAVAVGKWIHSLRSKGVIDARWDKAIELYDKGTQSLQQTDIAFSDNMTLFKQFATSLSQAGNLQEWYAKPENQALLANISKYEDDTKKELEAYYGILNKPVVSSSDKKIEAMAQIEQKLVPSYSSDAVSAT